MTRTYEETLGLIKKLGVVVPIGPGRRENVEKMLEHLAAQVGLSRAKLPVVLVCDGKEALEDCGSLKGPRRSLKVIVVGIEKHQPGQEPPRNVGVRVLKGTSAEIDWVWFLDSDVILEPTALQAMLESLEVKPPDCVLCGPYDWGKPGVRSLEPRGSAAVDPDQRWQMFDDYPANEYLRYHLGASLANFSGNLVWNIEEFERVGGFHWNLTASRADDGELGVRASVHGVATAFVTGARGMHLWHPINMDWVMSSNARDVPKINEWHPYIEQLGIIPRAEDGIRLNMICGECGSEVNTLEMWQHAAEHRRGAAFLPLRDKEGHLVGRAVVDAADLPEQARFGWCLSGKGYAYRKTSIGPRDTARQRTIFLHRALTETIDRNEIEVDHRNGDRLDCRGSNLRVVPLGTNAQNRHDTERGSSRYRGVSRVSESERWSARAWQDGKTVSLGTYDSEQEAAYVAEGWRAKNMPYSEPDPVLLAEAEAAGLGEPHFRWGTGRTRDALTSPPRRLD